MRTINRTDLQILLSLRLKEQYLELPKRRHEREVIEFLSELPEIEVDLIPDAPVDQRNWEVGRIKLDNKRVLVMLYTIVQEEFRDYRVLEE